MKTDIKAVRGILRGMGLLHKPPPVRVMESRKQREIKIRPSARQIMSDPNIYG